jgi:hypothetical protein
MTDRDIENAIAESLGWKRSGIWGNFWTCDGRDYKIEDGNPIPRYTSDLNAMHEAEMTLTDEQRFSAATWLMEDLIAKQQWSCCEQEHWSVAVFATARQRAEAYLRTLNLWKE